MAGLGNAGFDVRERIRDVAWVLGTQAEFFF